MGERAGGAHSTRARSPAGRARGMGTARGARPCGSDRAPPRHLLARTAVGLRVCGSEPRGLGKASAGQQRAGAREPGPTPRGGARPRLGGQPALGRELDARSAVMDVAASAETPLVHGNFKSPYFCEPVL